MADPEQTAKNVLAILGQIDDRLSSITNKVGQITAAGNSFGGAVGGGAGGGNGAATGAAGGSGGSGGGLGLASLPGSSSSSGGGGSGQNNLGLGRVAVQAAGSALAATVSRFGSDRVSTATTNQVLANNFSIRSGIPVNKFLFGQQLYKGLYGYNNQDLAQSASIIAQQAVPGSALYKQIATAGGQEALRNPGLSQAAVLGVGLQGGTPNSQNILRQYGIRVADPRTGVGYNAGQIAAALLKDNPALKNNAQLVTAAFQPGHLLDRAFTAAGYSPDEIENIQNDLFGQATGRVAQQSKTIDSSTKRRATAAVNRNLRTDQGVAEGAQTVNDFATKASKAADTMLSASQTFADAVGRATGASQQSGSKAVGFGAAVAHFFTGGPGGLKARVLAQQAGAGGGSGGPGSAPRGVGGGSGSSGGSGGSAGGSGSTGSKSLRHIWPVGPGGIGQKFRDPATGGTHPGVDFDRPMGTSIHAAADGNVLFAGPVGGFGSHFVAVFHPAEDKVTRYGHGSAMYVRTGDKVTAGQVIAAVGSEGNSTGPHLHLELANGQNVSGGYLQNLDPIPWLGGAGTSDSSAPNGASTSSSSSPTSQGVQAQAAFNGFGLITLNEGLTSQLAGGGGAVAGSSSASSSSSTSSGTSSGSSTPGTWSQKLPAAGQRYAGLFQAAGKKYGLNPAFLAAVADTESSFNASVTNSIGAAGLFQFIPSTAKGFGINPLDPSQATDAAGKYLSSLLKQFGGNVEQALNSYSGGGGQHYFSTVEGFYQQFGGGPVTGSFAQGSWELGRDQAAMVHKGEMIIPRGAAEQLRQRSRGGGGVAIYVTLQNASNAEAMRLVRVVKDHLDAADFMTSLGST